MVLFSSFRRKEVQDLSLPKIAIIGVTGVGKSSTINALFSTDLLVSTGIPGTKRAITSEVEVPFQPVENEIETPRGKLWVVDMPGLGESIAKDKEYLKIYRQVLPKVDAALWILDDDRDLAQIERYLQEIRAVISPDDFGRIVFCINKVDRLTGPDGRWLDAVNAPDTLMDKYIKDHARRVGKILRVSDQRVIPYSASKRYRLFALFRAIIDAIPPERHSSFLQTILLQDRVELMDERYRDEARRLFAELVR